MNRKMSNFLKLAFLTHTHKLAIMSEAITTPTITERQISTFSDEYKKRRRQQMLRFFGATALTLISCRVAYRGVKSRKCMFKTLQYSNCKHSTNY